MHPDKRYRIREAAPHRWQVRDVEPVNTLASVEASVVVDWLPSREAAVYAMEGVKIAFWAGVAAVKQGGLIVALLLTFTAAPGQWFGFTPQEQADLLTYQAVAQSLIAQSSDARSLILTQHGFGV